MVDDNYLSRRDDNYVGRLEAYTGRVREAGLPLDFRQKSKVNDVPSMRFTDHHAHNTFVYFVEKLTSKTIVNGAHL